MSKLKRIIKSWNDIAFAHFKVHGFKPYGKDGFGRITHGDVFQLFYFQPHRHIDSFTVEICIRPLFCENGEHLNLRPGNRLGKIATKPGLDKWWPCSTNVETDESMSEVLQLMNEFAMSFYNSTKTCAEIIQSYKKNFLGRNKFGNRVNWGTPGCECFDFGYIYLKAGNRKKASEEFEKCLQITNTSLRDDERSIAKKFQHLKQLCKTDSNEVDEFLEAQIQKSLDNLNIKNWFYADIYKTIFEQFFSPDEKLEAETLLQSIKKNHITVGADQLARAILVLADGNITELKRIVDSNYLGDPRDVIMMAVAKTKNGSYFTNPFEY